MTSYIRGHAGWFIEWLVFHLKAAGTTMRRMVDYLQQLLQSAESRGSKSTIVSPIGWVLAASLTALVAASRYSAPPWILVSLTTVVFVSLAGFLIAYGYFAATNPDFLRSEKYTLTKTAVIMRIDPPQSHWGRAPAAAWKWLESAIGSKP